MSVLLGKEPLTLADLRRIAFDAPPLELAGEARAAVAIAEIGAFSERRIALLIDATISGLPPFLVEHGGVNSGFMVAQVTAAALASELLAAAQGIDFRAPLKTSPALQAAHALVRSRMAFYDHDRYFAPDIAAMQSLVEAGAFRRFVPGVLPSNPEAR